MPVNRIVLVGRMTRAPELRTTTTGKSVVSFGIAVDRPKRGSEKETDFFNVTAWGQTADFVTNYLTKGRLIAIDGRLQQRKFTTSDGKSREVYEIVAENVSGLDRPKEGGDAPQRELQGAASSPDYDPFGDE